MTSDPWFSHWNYEFFVLLFQHAPHSARADDLCDLLISEPLLSTWVFAASFYACWVKDDGRRAQRRVYLISAVAAFLVACLFTLVLRPWVHWPAPVLNPEFRSLFPTYRWGNGTTNCFPSHSTLAYFMMAVGFWPISRRLSVTLSILALLLVSLPRIYAGGHYPIDVLFSCALGILALISVWRWFNPAISTIGLAPTQRVETICNLLAFLWMFELGEGFRGLELAAAVLIHRLGLHF